MTSPCSPTVRVYGTPVELARDTAALLLRRLVELQSVETRPLHLVLTGGSVGIQILVEAAKNGSLNEVDWSQIHVWWGDERFLPKGSPDRNETQARDTLISLLGDALPDRNVHPIPAPDKGNGICSPADAAEQYALELASFAPAGAMVPQFDVLLLGVGPDGHVASLFPGKPSLTVRGAATVPEYASPKPPAQRVSLTLDAINAAANIWVVAAGAEKADAVREALAGVPSTKIPAAGVKGRDCTVWRLDSAASQKLDPHHN